ncbi:MAG: electron transport complex subunit E [Pseudomonadales bacterium]|nr:electron transport complex subunit E [Pseudomonadales bacterium]
MSEPRIGDIALNGLWKNNPALVQLLGLCPLLAVSGSVVNALGMGLATALVLMGTNTLVSMVRHVVPDTIRLPAFVLIIAGAVTLVELLMQAYAYGLYEVLGIFLPLITTNCVVLGRAEAFASKNPVPLAALEGLMMGLGFSAVLVVLGALRELLGNGTLFADMQLLFGPMAAGWEVRPFGEQRHFLLAVLPPGAFLFTGLLIALKNGIDTQLKARAEAARAPQVPAGSKRVRVTGHIS